MALPTEAVAETQRRKVERALANLQRAEEAMLRRALYDLQQAERAYSEARDSARPAASHSLRQVGIEAAEQRIEAARRRASWWESLVQAQDSEGTQRSRSSDPA